jgi:hypothetical protein
MVASPGWAVGSGANVGTSGAAGSSGAGVGVSNVSPETSGVGLASRIGAMAVTVAAREVDVSRMGSSVSSPPPPRLQARAANDKSTINRKRYRIDLACIFCCYILGIGLCFNTIV